VTVSYTADCSHSLQLSLFEAERAWTHSHELAADPGYADNGTLRHRATGRFRRAVFYSAALVSQAHSLFSSNSGRISAGALLEVIAYHLTLQGRFYLRRDDFGLALDHLAVARAILAELAKDTTTSRDHSLYILFSDEIAPQIRFAAHSQGYEAAYNIDVVAKEANTSKLRDALVPGYDEIVRQLKGERAKEAASSGSLGRAMLREPLWEDKPVPIRNPELVDAFIKVQDAEDAMAEGKHACKQPKQAGTQTAVPPSGKETRTSAASKITRGRVAAFDDVLLALADAQQVAQKLVESKEVTLHVLHSQTPPHSFISYREVLMSKPA
jgi:signal recognition particle subunit SRP68